MSLTNAAESADVYFKKVPIIDLGTIGSKDPEERKRLAAEVRDACMLKNHGIPDSATDGALQMAKKFFSLPIETKMEVCNILLYAFHQFIDWILLRYSPLLSGNNDAYGKGDLQEGFEFGWEDPKESNGENTAADKADGVMAGANVWPKEADVPQFRERVLQYYYAAVNLGRVLFPIFALALNLPEDFFKDKTQYSAALMKLLHYPPQTGPVDERVIGIGAHTEYCFTILWQEPNIQALQVLNSEKEWVNVPPVPGTLVINLGDQFARWTNDIFKSTVHRVISPRGVERFSIPLFFGTDYNVKLEPMESCVSPDRPSKYEVVTAGEYVKGRLEATYNHRLQ
ncbi:2OG-Fe(II) oxygenase [Pholiota molesta]|nr:2OG-Fe(II) oxygenase [Pholiota molesta]